MFTQGSKSRLVVPCVINGQAVPLPESQNFPVVNGRTGDTVHYAQAATVDVATSAVDAAAQAFKKWKKITVQERRDILSRAADILEQKLNTVAVREMLETSCDHQWSRIDCLRAAKIIRHNAAAGMTLCGKIPAVDDTGNTSLIFKEPIGVVMIIPPWNVPMIMACRGISAALAAGCTVVLKASELSPWSFQLVLEIFKDAGLPDGVINQIQCTRNDAAAITEAVISHPSLRKIEFIGNANVGRIIGTIAAKHLKPVLMELGDQSPAIVLEDADLRAAAEKCVMGAMINHGQACFATERILVHEKIKDAFLEELDAVMKHTSVGDAVSSDGAQKAHDLIADALADGAKILIGENKLSSTASLQPSIITNIHPESRINNEEIWGPSATLATFSTTEAAIELANDTSFGLSASIFTKDYATALKMARELDFGQVQINSATFQTSSTAPVTGYKNSGWGSNGGGYAVEEFMFNKHVFLPGV